MKWKPSAVFALLAVFLALPVRTSAQWTELPGTAFTPFAQSSGLQTLHQGCHASGGVNTIVEAWNTAVYRNGRLYLVRLGGHADSCLNGTYSVALDSPYAWRIDVTPSNKYTPLNTPNGVFSNPYPNSTPQDAASVHSYNSQFLITSGPHAGKIYSGGGIYWSPGGSSVPHITILVNPDAGPDLNNAYERKATRPGGYGVTSAWNPVRNRGILFLSSEVREYDPVTDTYPLLFTASGASTSASPVAISPDGQTAFFIFGSGAVGTRLKRVDYATAATTKYQTLTTVGGAGLEDQTAPGLLWDANSLIAYGTTVVGGVTKGVVFRLQNPLNCGKSGLPNCLWEKILPGDNVLPPRIHANGLYSRFVRHGCQYFVLTDATNNVWSYLPPWTTDTCGPPPPPQFPVTTAVNPPQSGTLTSAPPNPVTVGATVTLSRTQNVGWAPNGYSGDAVCADSFTMPANAVSCTAENVPIMVNLVINTVGPVTTTGQGSYQLGTQATLTATPAAGFGNVTVSGDPGCQLGSITMDANKTCTVTATDIQPPTVTITSPTANQIIKQAGVFPITFTATDNVGVTGTTCKVAGQVVDCAGWNTTGMADGIVTVEVTAVDAAGNSTTATQSVIIALCVCP